MTATRTEGFHIRIPKGKKEEWRAAAKRDRRTLTNWVEITLDDAAAKTLARAARKEGR